MNDRRMIVATTLIIAACACPQAMGQTPNQPRVANGPKEPDWVAILGAFHDLSMFGDLLNPVTTTPEATPGLFRKAGPGLVRCTPIFALGLETTTRGGWYTPGPGVPKVVEVWNYTFKNTGEDLEKGKNLPPSLGPGAATEFDPGDAPFGLWVANDEMKDGGVFSQPEVVARVNLRLKGQPYKAMIYPLKDKATGKFVANSYLIGWEYSTNDDFQDVVCRLDNALLVLP